MARLSVWVLLGLALFTLSVNDLRVKADAPTEYECRPYIEKALQDLKGESAEATASQEEPETVTEEEPSSTESPIDVTSQEEEENTAAEETSIEEDVPESPEQLTPSEEVQEALFDDDQPEDTSQANEEEEQEEEIDEVTASEEDIQQDEPITDSAQDAEEEEPEEEENVEEETTDADAEEEDEEEQEEEEEVSAEADTADERTADSQEVTADDEDNEDEDQVTESQEADDEGDDEEEQPTESQEEDADTEDDEDDEAQAATEDMNDDEDQATESEEAQTADEDEEQDGEHEDDEQENGDDVEEPSMDSQEAVDADGDDSNDDLDDDDNDVDGDEEEEDEQVEAADDEQPSAEEVADIEASPEIEETTENSQEEDAESIKASEEVEEEVSAEVVEEESEESVVKVSEEAVVEETVSAEEEQHAEESTEEAEVVVENVEIPVESAENVDTTGGEEASEEAIVKVEVQSEEAVPVSEEVEQEVTASEESADKSEPLPEEDLLLEYEIPSNLRDTSHIYELLNINEEAAEKENALNKVADVILRDLKKIYDTAIKPLETLYKYRDLSNRHFGDPEIFSKPLILFMGPWSGGKSTILNYLTQNEYTPNSVRTGAEPSPAYFNILMHGDEPEVLDGTQLAADWTFSGLQKFGQGLLDRLRGQKLPNKLLERVNIVEIPGILEVRKQVSQYFPFNDACQWFIDRADIIFLVYDPSKLDVGPETEAILDQLKGREYQTRILLNKADQVKPEELLRVQGALIWNISPLMSSAQPPVMYTVSLWSNPFETGAPIRLLQAQERFLLLDLGQAIEKRIENKIASARRFAVRVRNHAKMVDCYLTTYYNHKTLFANKKYISEQIIGNPQQYHIYEGLSTLTNISRYDLPDPEVYRDFFHLNPLYEFKKLSETCTYFRGCPINKLDIAIAYDLPELVGKYKKLSEAALEKLNVPSPTTDFVRGKSSS
ncbi:probable serine/threonine-protein kinase kinX isoform X4 [Topomyia yanbarensis]|uniref:probable serine/threonine-protein kinase kinX isoform X4 n=1 Tax=Topomyia yanbarensis TaxID=2498891 RepID=UPI00273B468F|nr:probable serine/threonine-protein kinase kinX isoform X4 [Topomyia yanbarensis]